MAMDFYLLLFSGCAFGTTLQFVNVELCVQIGAFLNISIRNCQEKPYLIVGLSIRKHFVTVRQRS